jgi:plasmid replication initiation protein
MGTVKDPIQRRQRETVKDDLGVVLPTSVQKSYFMLSDAERGILNTALEKYRPGQSAFILVGGHKVLKPALRLMTWFRLVIEEVKDGQAVTSYTRWVDAVQVKGGENQEVYLTFSPRFEHIWLECKKSLLDYLAQQSAAIGLRSKYAIRLYAWAKDQLSAGTKRITLEELRAVLGSVIREAPLAAWANFRQRALNIAIAEINAKTDLNIALESLEKAEHSRVTALIFAINARMVSKGKT